MNKFINNSNPDEMLAMSKKIALYADNLRKDMKKLLSVHNSMHSCWSGRQYDDFTKILEDANRVIDKQVDNLEKISIDVENDAKQLKIALEAKMR